MAEALELKPCPFCGAKASFYSLGVETTRVDCGGCDAYLVANTKARAVTAWNRRSEPEALRLLGEAEKALAWAVKELAELDEYQKRPERGDWGVECAVCMGEWFEGGGHAHLEQARSALDKLRKGVGA